MQLRIASLLLVLASLAAPAAASSALGGRKMRGGLDAQALERELSAAMCEALGCGGRVDEERLRGIERDLEAMWRTLPKSAAGNIDRRSLRYLVHRHFNRKSALHIRGFEPTRLGNASGWGDADILSQRVPTFVESVLESRHKAESGFSMGDAAHLIAALEQLIFDSEGALLEKAYGRISTLPQQPLDQEDIGSLLQAYMVYWLSGGYEEMAEDLFKKPEFLDTVIPHWRSVVAFARGHAEALNYRRQTNPAAAAASGLARPGFNAMSPRYAFEDAHGMTGEITRSFASFWEAQCDSMKMQLLEMDTHHTGRVPLSKFYGTGIDADWRFGESEEYLRELGALDETSRRGKQVIIPNYIQAASNCIVTGQHYLVCCVNDCEVLLDEIERKVAAPTARPEDILAIVGNMSSHVTVDDDQPPHIDASLRSQLAQISEAHSGEVPIHGRLFAQWLHYVFPRECPFPHKSGAVAFSSPGEYGAALATAEEMQRYASEANRSEVPAGMGKEELQWMSQWSPEEELITDHLAHSLRAPWERVGVATGAALLLTLVLLGLFGMGSGLARGGSSGLLPTHQKAHFV